MAGLHLLKQHTAIRMLNNLAKDNMQGQMESVMNVFNFLILKYMGYCHYFSRKIAIATITSKLRESVLLLKYSDYLTTCDNQFGFKASHGTDMCI